MSGLPGTPGFPGFDGPKGQIQCLKYCILKPTQPFNILESVFLLLFLKEVVCAHQGCIYLIENTRKKLILLNIIQI